MAKNKDSHLTDDAPPFFGSWRAIYFFVISVLALLIIVFALISYYLQ